MSPFDERSDFEWWVQQLIKVELIRTPLASASANGRSFELTSCAITTALGVSSSSTFTRFGPSFMPRVIQTERGVRYIFMLAVEPS